MQWERRLHTGGQLVLQMQYTHGAVTLCWTVQLCTAGVNHSYCVHSVVLRISYCTLLLCVEG